MSGTVIHVIPRTLYVFDGVGLNSAQFNVPIARYIDISQFREATIELRVHTRSITGTGGPPKIFVQVIADAPTPEDPAQDFTTTAVAVSATIDSGTVVPSLVLMTVPANTGAMISIWLGVVQGTSTTGALQATISVDISEKS
jgi:hypothetical protein